MIINHSHLGSTTLAGGDHWGCFLRFDDKAIELFLQRAKPGATGTGTAYNDRHGIQQNIRKQTYGRMETNIRQNGNKHTAERKQNKHTAERGQDTAGGNKIQNDTRSQKIRYVVQNGVQNGV